MSLPSFSTQAELFSTAGLAASLFAPTDRYRLFAQLVYPRLASARPALENCYCPENGRVALEPVLMLGVSILQDVDGVPDRQAVEMLRYHAGWNFALNRQLGDPVFHPTSLVNFRNRLDEHQQRAVAFQTILDALQEVGLVSRQSRQRLDSTQMFGRVAKMNRLDCVRETTRLALKELEEVIPAPERPPFWVRLWERYVESQVDYRASAETLGRKLAEAGADAWQLLEWLSQPSQSERASGAQTQLLRRVFGEQFEVLAGQPAPLEREKVLEMAGGLTEGSQAQEPVVAQAEEAPELAASNTEAVASGQREFGAEVMTSVTEILPKDNGPLSSDRAQTPHEPEATYGLKGQGQPKNERVDEKVPGAESVSEAVLAAGQPTGNFMVGLVSPAAHQSDELGAVPMDPEQMGLEKPLVPYVDGPYGSAQKLAEGQAQQGQELIGPAQPTPQPEGRCTAEDFPVNAERVIARTGAAEVTTGAVEIQPKGKGQLSSDRVQNPHDPDATYAVKGQGQQKKEHVGYKVQVAESVSEAVLAPGEPTRNFLMGIVTHPAYESDELGAVKMEQEQAQMGLEKPPVQYVDGAYVSAQKLAEAQAQGRELIGPAQPAPQKDGRFTTEDFQVNVQERTALCPAGKTNTQCSRLEAEATGKVSYRFEFGFHCHDCPLRGQCLGKDQRHRTLVVGEHHTLLQARRQEQQTEGFKERMKHRNGIEGTQSELVRGHGLRRARSRGLPKVKLQNYFIGAACNVKRWIRREAWKLAQAVSAGAAEVASATAN